MVASDLLISPDRLAEERKNRPEYNPSEQERARVSAIKRKYEEKDVTKRAYERTWFINGSFLRGQHYVTWSEFNKNFTVPTSVSPNRIRLVINYILAYYRRTKARLTAHKPSLFVRPATNDQTDVERARNAGKVLESEFDRLEHFEKFKEGVGWALETGSWFYYLCWNPWAGEPMFDEQPIVDEYGQPQIDPETGQPATHRVPMTDESGRHLHTGDMELEIVSPYEILHDRNATSVEAAQWIIRSKIRPLSWIREHYPAKGEFVVGEDVKIHEYFQKRLTSLVGIHGFSSEVGATEKNAEREEEGAVVHEYWERPSAKHPDGQLVVIAGKVELFAGDNPYRHRRIPLIKVDDINLPGRFFGMSSYENGIPIQKNYNRARSQEVENRTLTGRPKLLVPKNCGMQQTSFDAEAGEKIEYRPGPRGEKPELIVPPSTAAATATEIQHTLNDLQEVLGWHEVSRGILPSANIPAEGIEKLQMSDETMMGDTATNIDVGLVKLGKMMLSLAQQFWDEERMVRAGGEGARLEAMHLRGDDLAGDMKGADYLDVRVIPHSTLLKNPEKERAKVMELMQMGILNPVSHRELILKALDVANSDEVFQDIRLDEQWAQRENELMEQGMFSVPRDFENHGVHLEILNRYRKSERYRRLPPNVQQLYDQHAQLHETLMVQMEQKKVLMQASIAAAGGMGQPGGEPGAEGGPSGGGAPRPAPKSQPARN